jgi:hypothetical protein
MGYEARHRGAGVFTTICRFYVVLSTAQEGAH